MSVKKFKVLFRKTVSGESIIKARSEEEAKKKAQKLPEDEILWNEAEEDDIIVTDVFDLIIKETGFESLDVDSAKEALLKELKNLGMKTLEVEGEFSFSTFSVESSLYEGTPNTCADAFSDVEVDDIPDEFSDFTPTSLKTNQGNPYDLMDAASTYINIIVEGKLFPDIDDLDGIEGSVKISIDVEADKITLSHSLVNRNGDSKEIEL